jgi:hypothetical protein
MQNNNGRHKAQARTFFISGVIKPVSRQVLSTPPNQSRVLTCNAMAIHTVLP